MAVEDLLGRKPVRLETEVIRYGICDQVILVTGAAGSIGSELCRQIARFRPAALVAYEISETALFYLDREMRQSFPDVPFFSEIGSIQNRQRFTEVLRQHRPAAIYHAAAYKHVPLMESHIAEAVENNIFGTYNVIAAAAEERVPNFVMISSDKAVRPANVMGVTKRVAELIVKAFQESANCVSVRFGNVLGSNGSVIPIFKQQIAAGGPVEVTHPDVRRFFMTIPEAAQLVLQAAAMGRGGEIFVLDMGESIRIDDLARSLIALSGFQPDEEIGIVYTGLRPGEKLYEELSALEEETSESPHEKIKVFVGAGLPFEEMMEHLGELRKLVARRDSAGLILKLKEIVPDYNPSLSLLRQLVPQENMNAADTVTSLRNLALAVMDSTSTEQRGAYPPLAGGHSENLSLSFLRDS